MNDIPMTPEQTAAYAAYKLIIEEAEQSESELVSSKIVAGGTFILDAPDHVPAVWGRGNEVLWASGESMILAGPPGVGKTTVAGQLVRARIIGGEVLGYPIERTGSRVLYLAMDRPRQIARALRRTLGDIPREVLDDRLRVWQGPPVADIAQRPETLKGYADLAGADTIIVDSLKDAAIGLGLDEVGAGYNRARQYCTAEGIEVLELHHLTKNGPNGTQPNNLAGLYGSAWLSAGAGSVVLLWGAAGDPIVSLTMLKTPAEEVGPYRVIHDHTAGTSAVWHSTDLLAMATAAGSAGITAKAAACALFTEEKPSAAQVEKARRRLNTLSKAGDLDFTEGDVATSRPARWTLTDPLTRPIFAVTPHDLADPSRSADPEHGLPLTDPLTTLTSPTPHVSHPPYVVGGGNAGACRLHGTDYQPEACNACEQLTEAAS